MSYYTYITTHLPTYKFYVGVRKCPKGIKPHEDVRYFGSGTIIKRMLKKYPREQFHKRVWRVFSTKQEARAAEKAHVNIELLRVPGCLNLIVGGNEIVQHTTSAKERIAEKVRSSWLNNKEKRCENISKQTKTIMNSPEMRKKVQEGQQKARAEGRGRRSGPLRPDVEAVRVAKFRATLDTQKDVFRNAIKQAEARKTPEQKRLELAKAWETRRMRTFEKLNKVTK